jgi:hypothetical protein
MSNHLAIATVTATLRQLLQNAVNVDFAGADVTTDRPDQLESEAPAPGVNLFLYQVTPNAHWRNSDLPTRRADGALVQRPRAALDLHYLLSFIGNETELVPQRLFGIVARTLHAAPILSPPLIEDTLAVEPYATLLAGSDLADEIDQVRVTPAALSLEELSKLWSVFFQKPYLLSAVYQASVVLIESAETPRTALPVQERFLRVMPFQQPIIDEVIALAGRTRPILAGDTLVLRGRQLRGEVTRVLFGETEVTPSQVQPARVEVPLTSPPFAADTLRAGVQGVQVVHLVRLRPAPQPLHRGFASNVAAFVLRPQVTPAGATSTSVTLQVDPPVRAGQRVTLLLNTVPTAAETRAYTFQAESPDDDTETFAVDIAGVEPGDYFVRLQVDGAESPLDLDPASVTFRPTVTIP